MWIGALRLALREPEILAALGADAEPLLAVGNTRAPNGASAAS